MGEQKHRDRGISGSKDSSPQLNRLMAAAHQRKVDAIVVWKIDRFWTLAEASGNRAGRFWQLTGVAFISLRDNLDLSTPSGRLVFHVVAAMAEFERELIRERVTAELRNARAKGAILGRPRVTVDARAVARLRAEGHTWAEVCRTFNLSRRTARRAARTLSAEV